MDWKSGMELHHLRHFMAVAEELNFTRAARILHIAQPALSQSIKRLEASLGLELFTRSRRKVELTPAGKAFLAETKATLAQVERAQSMARRTAAGEVAQLNLGYVTPAVFRVMPSIIGDFKKTCPDIEVKFEELSVEEQVRKLRRGELDLGIIMGRHEVTEDIALEFLRYIDVAAAIPSSWPLAKQREIRLKDLEGQPMITVPRHRNPDIYDEFVAACRMQGFSPRFEHEVGHPLTVLSLVAGGFGIGLIGGATTSFWVKDITLTPIADAPGDSIVRSMFVAWIPRAETPALKRFLASIRDTIQQRSAEW
jgi:DNA-binding transcriptional LysR family regulator